MGTSNFYKINTKAFFHMPSRKLIRRSIMEDSEQEEAKPDLAEALQE